MSHENSKRGALADIAIDAIRTLITDPNTPPAVRLRAAKIALDLNDGAGDGDGDDNNSKPTPLSASPRQAQPLTQAKVGRNDYCPCGSGLKFKKCCLLKIEHQARSSPTVIGRPATAA